MDITNSRMVGAGPGSRVAILNPPVRGAMLTPEDAIVFAAWLVAIADAQRLMFSDPGSTEPTESLFQTALRQIQES